MSDNTSLSIRVRRVDDLQDIGLQPNAGDNNGIALGGEDVFLVSHRGNDNGQGGYVTFSRKVALDTIRDYIASYSLQMLSGVSLSDLADGDSVMNEISEKINQIPVQNSYTSNCYVRQSQYGISFTDNWLQQSGTHTFMQDTNAQIHITLNASGSGTFRTGATDLICLQVFTNNDWQTICSEPITKTIVEVDFHGFFYAGTQIRAKAVNLNPNTTNLSVNTFFAGPSEMDVLEISNDKPFPTDSFSWRASIPQNPPTASISEPNSTTISANGFISFSGDFLNSNTEAASKFSTTQKWTTPYVYGVQQLADGGAVNLANTYNPVPYAQTTSKGMVSDTFQSRMYYVQTDDGRISVRLSTDIKMIDKPGVTNIAGYKNAALIQYVDSDEVSNVVDEFVSDPTISGFNQVSGLSGEFTDGSFHKFTYGKYLGRPAGINVASFNTATSEFGTPRKSLAFIGIGSEGPNFMRQRKNGGDWVYSMGNPDGTACVPSNTLVKNTEFAVSDLTATPYIDDPESDELCGSVGFEYEVLDKNLAGIRCFPVDLLSLNKSLTGSTAVNGKTEWSPKCVNYHDIGAPLLQVDFAPSSTATIDDSAFAFCTSLRKVDVPESMSMNGNTTFYMGLSSNLNAQLLKH